MNPGDEDSVFHPDQLERDVVLAPKTTIQIGGPARFFFRATSPSALAAAVSWARSAHLPLFLLGGGSNILFADEGFPGLVVAMEMKGIDKARSGDRVLWTVGAGEQWDTLVAASVTENLAGIECLSGIPGKVGAAPIQNIGAYGQEVAGVIDHLVVLDMEMSETRELSLADCRFGYRTSRFKHGPDAGRYAVVSVCFALKPNGDPTVRYPDLQRRLGENPSLAEVRAAVLAVRREKSMVADPRDANARGCGSFFTNPVIDRATYARFLAREVGEHPHYPAGEGYIKLSAAWLIQNAGFGKGYRHGPVGLSEKHCLALINRDGGRAADILDLAEKLKQGVSARFGIELEPEPIILAGR